MVCEYSNVEPRYATLVCYELRSHMVKQLHVLLDEILTWSDDDYISVMIDVLQIHPRIDKWYLSVQKLVRAENEKRRQVFT